LRDSRPQLGGADRAASHAGRGRTPVPPRRLACRFREFRPERDGIGQLLTRQAVCSVEDHSIVALFKLRQIMVRFELVAGRATANDAVQALFDGDTSTLAARYAMHALDEWRATWVTAAHAGQSALLVHNDMAWHVQSSLTAQHLTVSDTSARSIITTPARSFISSPRHRADMVHIRQTSPPSNTLVCGTG
jgi:hypothetical protein